MIEFIVAAISMAGALCVHFVALLVRGLARVAPEQFALIGARATEAVIAIRFAAVAGFGVHFVNVIGAVFALPGAILRQVTFIISRSAHCPSILRHASLHKIINK